MDRIAERAGLNKRLIYYYFEDKETAVPGGAGAGLPRHPRPRRQQLHLLEVASRPTPAAAGRVHLELLPRAPEFLTC
jgi:hypothetical protein